MRVQIEAPEFETRAAILKKKAEVERSTCPTRSPSSSPPHIRSNVRELEGALMRLAAFASLKSEPITVPLARDVLGDVIPPPGYRPPIERIQEAVAAHYGLTVAKLTSASREQKIALPRQVAMYLCRELAKEKFQPIAERFNKKDHTTVIAAVERCGLLRTDLRTAGGPHREARAVTSGPRPRPPPCHLLAEGPRRLRRAQRRDRARGPPASLWIARGSAADPAGDERVGAVDTSRSSALHNRTHLDPEGFPEWKSESFRVIKGGYPHALGPCYYDDRKRRRGSPIWN